MDNFEQFQITSDNSRAYDGTSSNGSSPREAKISRLQSARDRARERQGAVAGLGPNDLTADTYVEHNGFVDSTANKIWNDYSIAEVESLGESLNQRYGLVPTENGYMQYDEKGKLIPFEGDINDYASFYTFGTKDGNDKSGMWGGVVPQDRYKEEYFAALAARNRDGAKPFIGPNGVDPTNLKRHWIMPHLIVQNYEGIYNGSSDVLGNRVVRQTADGDLNEYRATRDSYGTGATEVYRPFTEEQLKPVSDERKAELLNDFLGRFRPDSKGVRTEEELADLLRERHGYGRVGDNFLGRTTNNVSGFLSTVVSMGIVNPAHALLKGVAGSVGISTEGFGTEEERNAAVHGWFNYDSSYADRGFQEVRQSVSNIYDNVKDGKPVELKDIYDIVGAVYTSPELLAVSLGATLVTLFGAAKVTKVGSAIKLVEKGVKSGKLTKEAGKIAVAKIRSEATLGQNINAFLAKNAGYNAMVLGETANRVERFAENNDGEFDAGDILRITAITAATVGLEKLSGHVTFGNLTSLGKRTLGKEAGDAVASAAKAATAKEYKGLLHAHTRLLGSIAYGTGRTVEASAVEGVTEYLQTLGETFSFQYATKKYGHDAALIIFDEETQKDALTGGAIGVVSGQQMYSGGALVSKGLGLAGKGVETALGKLPAKNPLQDQLDSGAITEEELKQAADDYAKAFINLNEVVNVTEGNIGSIIQNIETIRELEPVAGVLQPDVSILANKLIGEIETTIVKMVEESTDGNVLIKGYANALNRKIDNVPGGKEAAEAAAKEAEANFVGPKPETTAERMAREAAAVEKAHTRLIEEARAAQEYKEMVERTPDKSNADIDNAKATISLFGDIDEIFNSTDEVEKSESAKKILEAAESLRLVAEAAPIGEITESVRNAAIKQADNIVIDLASRGYKNEKVVESSTEQTVEGQNAQEADPRDADGVALSDRANKILAMKVMKMVLAKNDGKPSKELEEKLHSFAKLNGVAADIASKIIKNYASVELESTIGDRGVYTRSNRLTLLLDSGSVDTTRIRRNYAEEVKFYTATEESIGQLQEGLILAQQKAEQMQVTHPKGGNSVTVKTKYMTDANSSSKGAPFTINVVFSNGKWAPSISSVAETNKRIAAKTKTSAGLKTLLERYHQEAAEHLDPNAKLNFNEYRITHKGTKVDPNVKGEITYIKNIVKALREVLGLPAAKVNKIILGKVTAPYWASDKQRAKENALITNVATSRDKTGTYSESDVVYLHALDSSTPSKKKTEKDPKGKKDGKTDNTATDVDDFGEVISIEDEAKASKTVKDKDGNVIESTGFSTAEFNVITESLAIEMDAAMKAGATIVLSSAHPNNSNATPESLRGRQIAAWLKGKGYMAAGPTGNQQNIFIPKTKQAEARYAKLKVKADIEKKLNDRRDAVNIKARNLEIELRVTNSDNDIRPEKNQRSIETIEAEIEANNNEMEEFFKEAAKKQILKELEEQKEADRLALPEGKVLDEDKYVLMPSRLAKLVAERVKVVIADYTKNLADKTIQAIVDTINDPTKTFGLGDIEGKTKQEGEILQEAVRQFMEQEAIRLTKTNTLLAAWKEAVKQRIEGKDLIKVLNKAMKASGVKVVATRTDTTPEGAIVLQELGHKIISETLNFGNETKIYYVNYIAYDKNGQPIEKSNIVYSLDPVLNKDGEVVKNGYVVGEALPGTEVTEKSPKDKKELIIHNIGEYDVDSSKFVKLNRPTPLNTFDVQDMPSVFGVIAKSTKAALAKVLAPLEKAEKDFKKPVGKEPAGQKYILDSPARNFIFDKDGNIKENVAAAVGVAIRAHILANKNMMLPGYKEDSVVAAMFGVHESQITPAQRKFANENGVLGKTMINSVGKAVFSALGIGKNRDPNLTKGYYERLAADLGNIAVLVGQQEGLFNLDEVKSNDFAKLRQSGVEYVGDKGETTTTFITITNVSQKGKGKFVRKVPSKAVEEALVQQALVEESVPDIVGRVKSPHFGKPISEEQQERYLEVIRNDQVGAAIPAKAAETAKHLMNTKHELLLEEMQVVMGYLDSKEGTKQLKARLGFVEISDTNSEYVNMTFADKEVQQAINDGVEKSIKNLTDLYNDINNKIVPNEYYYPVYYQAAQRFGYDVNTVNGQTDKFHRFLSVPSVFITEYKIDRSNNTIMYEYTKDGKKQKPIDVSLVMRAALGQAFGIGIDKEATVDIIKAGNALMGMTKQQVKDAEKEYMLTGSFSFDFEGAPLTFKPDHLSHALMGFVFLKNFTGDKTSTTVSTALFYESDAITSGYGNKLQQLGLVKGLAEELSRAGIIVGSDVTGEITLLEVDEGMNDRLASKGFSDSYQATARGVIGRLNDNVEVLPKKYKDAFEGIKELLPGVDIMTDPDQGVISKALRTMFKFPFMTFNYSASIASIRASISGEIIETMMKDIAKANMKEDSAATRVATYLASITTLDDVELTAETFQKAIRENNLSKIKATVNSVKATNKPNAKDKSVEGSKKVGLDEYLTKYVLDDTYGAATESMFNEKFGDFIHIQDSTNDAFKLAFVAFNQLFNERVKKHWAEKDENGKSKNLKLTEGDVLKFIDELRTVFPLIAGPISEKLTDNSDGVYIYDTESVTASSVISTMPSPQTRLAPGGKTATKKVNPLMQTIVAAANAGAVLPIIAIDGAQLSGAINLFVEDIVNSDDNLVTKDADGNEVRGAGIIPLHDAVAAKLPLQEDLAFKFNKNTYNLNSEYSLINSIVDMMKKANDVIQRSEDALFQLGETALVFQDRLKVNSGAALGVDFKDAKKLARKLEAEIKELQETGKEVNKKNKDIRTLKKELVEAKKGMTIEVQSEQVLKDLQALQVRIGIARKNMYPDGTLVSSLVSMGGSIFDTSNKDQDRANRDFVDNFKPLFNTGGTLKRLPTISDPDFQAYEIEGHETMADSYFDVEQGDYVWVSMETASTDPDFNSVITNAGEVVADVLARGAYLLFAEDVDTANKDTDAASYIYNDLLESGKAKADIITVKGLEHKMLTKLEPKVFTAPEVDPLQVLNDAKEALDRSQKAINDALTKANEKKNDNC